MDDILKAAQEAVKQEHYSAAIELLLPLAKAGDKKAQSNLGTLYQLGLGTERDLKEAIKWFKRAVDQGEGSAAHNLGTIYLTGSPEIPLNRKESKKWYRKARDLGFIVATNDWYR